MVKEAREFRLCLKQMRTITNNKVERQNKRINYHIILLWHQLYHLHSTLYNFQYSCRFCSMDIIVRIHGFMSSLG